MCLFYFSTVYVFFCQYRAWATPETVDQTALALKTGTDTLTFYENFFGIKFPIPKQGKVVKNTYNGGIVSYKDCTFQQYIL